MRNVAGYLVLFLVTGAIIVSANWAIKTVEKDDPHFGMLAQQNCAICHDMDDLKNILGEEFVTAIMEPCYRCHSQDDLGRSHPVDVDLKRNRRLPDMEIPYELLVGGQWDDLLTCATCHEVHGDWKAKTKGYSSQEPIRGLSVQGRFYSTFYLRVPGDPKRGWEPLCKSCHSDY